MVTILKVKLALDQIFDTNQAYEERSQPTYIQTNVHYNVLKQNIFFVVVSYIYRCKIIHVILIHTQDFVRKT